MARHFPNFLDAYLKYTAGHEATEKVHKWSIISVLAATMERRIWMDRGFYRLYANLYVLIIGRSGIIKKSTSTAIAVSLFRELQGARLMSERLTAGSLIAQMALSGKRFKSGEEQISQSPVFAYASELAVLMDEVFGSIVELLTTFYDCIPHDSTKPWQYHTKKDGELKIFGPCLNLLGCSTKSWLKKCIPAHQMEGGFASRCIFVVENDLPDNLRAWPEVTNDMNLHRVLLIEDLRHIYSMTGKVTVNEMAKELFTKWYEYHMREVMPRNQDPRMIGYMARKGDMILKLGMIHSVATGDSLEINEYDIVWANEALSELEKHWRSAFGDIAGEGLDDLPFELRNYVRKRVKVKVSEIHKAWGKQFPGTEIDSAIATLLNLGELIHANLKADGEAEAEPHLTFIGSDLNLL